MYNMNTMLHAVCTNEERNRQQREHRIVTSAIKRSRKEIKRNMTIGRKRRRKKTKKIKIIFYVRQENSLPVQNVFRSEHWQEATYVRTCKSL